MDDEQMKATTDGTRRVQSLDGYLTLGIGLVLVVVNLVAGIGGWAWPLAGAMVVLGVVRILTAPLQAKATGWAARKGAERRERSGDGR